MDVTSREPLLADVEALKGMLEALPASEKIDTAIYHCERLHVAIRTSHTEGTRFAAFTVNKIIKDLGALPPAVVEAMARIRAALEAAGLELRK